MTAEEAMKEIYYELNHPPTWTVETLQRIAEIVRRHETDNRPPVDDDMPF
jgi:predicted trehalose synthase